MQERHGDMPRSPTVLHCNKFDYSIYRDLEDTMTMQKFIDMNRRELLASMTGPHTDDDEIELWILNDEGLYEWARSSGVDV